MIDFAGTGSWSTVPRSGESVSYEVPVGSHTVEVQIDWCGSEAIEFDLVEAQRLVVECCPGGSQGYGIRGAIRSPKQYITLRAAP
ncbi:MAG: hypothetical protein ACR2PK_17195 [Acidimicrobiales bacterium]